MIHNLHEKTIRNHIHMGMIAALMLLCITFYYMDFIITQSGLSSLQWTIFYTVHDLHRALFLIPAIYAAYIYRISGTIVVSITILLATIPRALFISPYPNPLLRAFIFMISLFSLCLLLSLLLNNRFKCENLQRDLQQSQKDALRETTDYLRSLISYANGPIMAWNGERRITIFNAAFERLTGFCASEVLRQPIDILFPEASKVDALFRIEQALNGKYWESEEIAVRNKDGSVNIVLWNTANIYDKNKTTLLATIAQGQDITERKHTEEQLRESEDRFKNFFENSVVGMSITLPSGKVHVNAAFKNMLGYSGEGMNNLTWQDLTHPDDIELTQRAIDQILSGEIDSAHLLKRFVHRNGSPVWTDLTSSLRRDKEGQPLYLMSVIVDITQRKEAEMQREAAIEEVRRLNENLEKIVQDRTAELQKTIAQLEETNRVFVDRELKMMELKKQILQMETGKMAS